MAAMKMAPIALLFGTVLLVGWFAPHPQTGPVAEPASGATLEAPEGMARINVHRNTQWLSGQTVLSRQPDGHFYTPASIGGAQVHFLVDTGASIVALTADDAGAIGLSWDPANVRPIGRGASGTVHGVPVTLDRVEINGLEVRGVAAAIIPEGLDVSLLGQSYLSKIENVEISEDQMRLGS